MIIIIKAYKYYLILINLVSFLLIIFDKFLAKINISKSGYLNRIPENTFHGIALIGGGFGGGVGMLMCNHKLRKRSFYMVYGFIVVVNLAVTYLILN